MGIPILTPTQWAAVALAGLLGVQTLRLAWAAEELAETKRSHAEQLADAQRTARVETDRRWMRFKEAADDAAVQTDASRAARDRAAGAADRLRQRTADTLARVCNPAPAASAPEAAPAHLLADMQRRLSEAARQLADYAEASRIDAESCEAVSGYNHANPSPESTP